MTPERRRGCDAGRPRTTHVGGTDPRHLGRTAEHDPPGELRRRLAVDVQDRGKEERHAELRGLCRRDRDGRLDLGLGQRGERGVAGQRRHEPVQPLDPRHLLVNRDDRAAARGGVDGRGEPMEPRRRLVPHPLVGHRAGDVLEPRLAKQHGAPPLRQEALGVRVQPAPGQDSEDDGVRVGAEVVGGHPRIVPSGARSRKPRWLLEMVLQPNPKRRAGRSPSLAPRTPGFVRGRFLPPGGTAPGGKPHSQAGSRGCSPVRPPGTCWVQTETHRVGCSHLGLGAN